MEESREIVSAIQESRSLLKIMLARRYCDVRQYDATHCEMNSSTRVLPSTMRKAMRSLYFKCGTSITVENFLDEGNIREPCTHLPLDLRLTMSRVLRHFYGVCDPVPWCVMRDTTSTRQTRRSGYRIGGRLSCKRAGHHLGHRCIRGGPRARHDHSAELVWRYG